MMNFGGELPIFDTFLPILESPLMFEENLPKRDPCLENFGPKNPPIASTRYVTPPGINALDIQIDIDTAHEYLYEEVEFLQFIKVLHCLYNIHA